MADSEIKRPSYVEIYEKLRTSYLNRLENSLQAIQTVLTQRQLGKLTRDDLVRTQYLAHGLAGSGSMFGFPQVTEAGRNADTFLTNTLKALPENQRPNHAGYPELETLMLDLQKVCRSAVLGEMAQLSAQILYSDKAVKELKFHVLLVDDDDEISELLYLHLQKKGIRVTPVQDGSAALRMVAKTPPDLIILDISMPGMSGHDVLKHLKQDPKFAAIPILMMTGKVEDTGMVSALDSGAIDYIAKPFDLDTMAARIEEILDAARYTVLIADDDPMILELLNSTFRHAGFKVLLADDGAKAWDHILKAAPHLVILDRMMPGMEGLAILKNMRSEPSMRNIPVIILSARNEEQDIEMGLRMGAQQYIAKPFLPDDLIVSSLELLKNK